MNAPQHISTETPTQRTGRIGEQLAGEFLQHQGYEVLARNWRTRQGELDIVARHGRVAVAVEVKTRRGTGYGAPLESITHRKLLKLRTLFAAWLKEQAEPFDAVRIDAIGVLIVPGAAPEITHLQGLA